MSSFLWIVILAASIILSLSILMQNKGAGLSLTFGGSGNYYSSSRGIQKFLHYTTIVSVVVLAILVLIFNFAVPPRIVPTENSDVSEDAQESDPDIGVRVGDVTAVDSEGNPVKDISVSSVPIKPGDNTSAPKE